MGRWSGKDERIDGAVSYLLPAAGCVNLALGTKTRKKKQVVKFKSLHPYRPVLEVGVISEVAQPGLSYRLSQFIMVSR